MARNPFDDLEQLFDRMEAQFEGSSAFGTTQTPLDVIEEGDAYLVKAELPGFDADDLDLTYADGRLQLRADRSTHVEQSDDAAYVRRERSTTVDRTVRIPEGVDADGIEADFDAGVLTVRLPKLDPDDGGKRIEIE